MIRSCSKCARSSASYSIPGDDMNTRAHEANGILASADRTLWRVRVLGRTLGSTPPTGSSGPRPCRMPLRNGGFPLTLRMQPGYDHSYHFIASFIGEHLAYHSRARAGSERFLRRGCPRWPCSSFRPPSGHPIAWCQLRQQLGGA